MDAKCIRLKKLIMKKSDREIVFNKYGGKCAYCGDPLQKAWHVDHAEPIQRKQKLVGGGYFHADTGKELTNENIVQAMKDDKAEYRRNKLVSDGCHKPENDKIENMMPACPSCNINKHSMNIEEFRAFIQRFTQSLNKTSVIYKIARRYGLIQETEKKVIFYFETIKSNNH